MRVLLSVLTGLTLSACGGGGSSDVTRTPTPPAPPSSPSIALKAQNAPQAGESVGLVAQIQGQYTNVQWRQISGPSAELLDTSAEVTSFDANQAGEYVFEATASVNGQQQSERISVSVTSPNGPVVQLRPDRVVPEQLAPSNPYRTGKQTVSLRLDSATAFDSATWSQTSGPTINFDTDTGPNATSIFFAPPAVSSDQLAEFEVTVTYADGQTASEQAFVLIKNVEADAEDGYFPRYFGQIISTSVKPYRADSPYAEQLTQCVYSNTIDSSCQFSRLPLLGMQTATPTVDDVLDRVVVSHPWMGQRFEEYLRNSPAADDMLRLLRATTAVVISYDIRPAFYWSATGAIYLDADYLWRTPQERDTLLTSPDYRAGFGDALQFSMGTYYAKQQSLFFAGFPISQRLTRPFSEMEKDLSRLMYHELAHANDYIDASRWNNLAASQSPLSASQSSSISDVMSQRYPLTSQTMLDLAALRFRSSAGSEPAYTDIQKSYRAEDIGYFFDDDSATDFYSYSSIAEDLAMYFQHIMMQTTYGVDTVTVIYNTDDGLSGWAEQNRVSRDDLSAKARFILDGIIPELESQTILNGLMSDMALTPGESVLCTVAPADPRCQQGKIQQRTWLNENDLRPATHTHSGRPTQPLQ